jgi:Cu(I)/Ag(I) efflux system membrane protein CusA/SilA
MISSTVLTLCVIPALYAWVKQWQLERESRHAAEPDTDAVQPAART